MASQTITGPDLQYTQDNLRCFAASGVVRDAGTGGANTSLLDFVTGSGYVRGKLDFSNTSSGGQDVYFQLLYNGKIVIDLKEGSASLVPFKFDVIIPPHTTVKANWGSAGTFDGNCFLTGTVHEYLPVRN